MANHDRILSIIFGKEHQLVQSFLDPLKSASWRGHVEFPAAHDGVCGFRDGEMVPPTCGTCDRQALGSILFPAIRILTREGVRKIDDCLYLPQFAYDNPFDQANAVIGAGSYPGFARPEATDHIAVLMGESRGGVPYRWFQKVIEDNYQAGLRLFARCFDVGEVSYGDGEIERSIVFYSSDDAEHYARLTEKPVREIKG